MTAIVSESGIDTGAPWHYGDPMAEQRAATVDDGCRFRNRCQFAMDVCTTRPPTLPAAAGHTAKCWLFDEATMATRTAS